MVIIMQIAIWLTMAIAMLITMQTTIKIAQSAAATIITKANEKSRQKHRFATR